MSYSNFTNECARSVLEDIISAINSSENLCKISAAKESAGSEMLKMMQLIFPLIMQIEMEVLKDYGFPEGREGIVQFSQMLQKFARHDPEIARLHQQIQSHYMSTLPINRDLDNAL
ncbi:protein C10 [Ctenocephalides felis]|uniref:protein C10 n=1 Tax=Ctenocephalides felis TaxID=7515 RepID=UPI000E6E28B1|nr:protein C10 [Ctenocephalides felis]